jgi:hypothetical protein
MSFQSVPDTVEVVFDFLMGGAPTANRLTFLRPGGYSQANVDVLAGAMSSAMGSLYLPYLTGTQQFLGARVRGLSVSTDVQGSSNLDAGTGALVETCLPNNVSLCLTLRTALTGRSARGRFYCQAPTFSDLITPNTTTVAYADAMVAILSAITANAGANGWTHVITSRYHNGAQRAVGVTYPVTSIIHRNVRLDSQRGRLPLPS